MESGKQINSDFSGIFLEFFSLELNLLNLEVYEARSTGSCLS
jgi:hypothetical protein